MKNSRSTVLKNPLNRNGMWGFFVRIWPAIICILLFALNSIATAQPNAKNVLIFFHVPAPVVDPAYVDLVESIVRARVPGPVNFYIEHMEATRAEEEDYQRNLTNSL